MASDEVFDPEKFVSIEYSMGLWEYLARELDDPGIPIHMVQNLSIEDYYAFGFAIMTSADVSEAFARATRFSQFYTDSGIWEIDISKDKVAVIWNRDFSNKLGPRLANENTLAEFVNSLRRTTGEDLNPQQVQFRHACPRSIDAHTTFFSAPISFDCPNDCLIFPTSLLSVPLKQPNPALSAFFEQYLEDKLEEIVSDESWLNKVRTALIEALPSGVLDSKAVAKKLDELGIHYIEAGWPGLNPKSEYIIEASRQALTDSINYKLLKNQTG